MRPIRREPMRPTNASPHVLVGALLVVLATPGCSSPGDGHPGAGDGGPEAALDGAADGLSSAETHDAPHSGVDSVADVPSDVGAGPADGDVGRVDAEIGGAADASATDEGPTAEVDAADGGLGGDTPDAADSGTDTGSMQDGSTAPADADAGQVDAGPDGTGSTLDAPEGVTEDVAAAAEVDGSTDALPASETYDAAVDAAAGHDGNTDMSDDDAGPDDVWVALDAPADADVAPEDTPPADPGPSDSDDADSGGLDIILTPCEELGIGDGWEGTWEGAVDYDVQSNGLVYPEQGVFYMIGDLSFAIECIDSQLVVSGVLSGQADTDIPNSDPMPVDLEIQGDYDPATETLTAQITYGAVSLLGLVELYLEGSFAGELQDDGTLAGGWDVYSTGTNTPLVTADAVGDGIWTAHEAEGGP